MQKEHMVLSALFPDTFAGSHEHRIQPDAQCGGTGVEC